MQSLKNFAQSYCDDEYLTKDSWQLYHERADKFYTSTISLDDDFFNGMALCGGRIKGSTAKVQLFRWLLLDAKGEATCGQGVYI